MSETTLHCRSNALGREYAIALYRLAEKQQQIDVVLEETRGLRELWQTQVDLRELLSMYTATLQQREERIKRLFANHVSDLVLRFLLVIADNKRLVNLGEILAACEEIWSEKSGGVEVLVTWPAQPDETQIVDMTQKIKSRLNRPVRLRNEVDPALIAGVCLRVGDELIDASVAGHLRQLTCHLTSATAQHARLVADVD